MGYGLAYWQWHTNVGVFYPIPLNWVMASLRWLHHSFLTPPGRLATEIDRAFHMGLEEGTKRAQRATQATDGREFQRGWDACLAHLERHVDQHFGAH